MDKNIEKKYWEAGEIISKAGGTHVIVNETLIKLLRYFINEDELDFIAAYREQKSQTLDQLKESTGLSEGEIMKRVNDLSGRGVIFDQPNSKGVKVYRLLPLLNVGTFEYTFMGKLEMTQRNREIAALFTELFKSMDKTVQEKYDSLVPIFKKMPPIDRTVPVHVNSATGKTIRINRAVDAHVDKILPTQRVEELINKYDEIALGHCFCRHYKDVSGKPCKVTKERETCFTFGKSAQYTTSHGFARMITKGEALAVLKKAEEDGLVHKAYHPNFDTTKDETSICNCCRCCCGNSVDNMIFPITNATNYLAVVDKDLCIGCGKCVDVCHTGSAYLNDDKKADRVKDTCIGCGVCAQFCPVDAISLVEGERIVTILPQKKL